MLETEERQKEERWQEREETEEQRKQESEECIREAGDIKPLIHKQKQMQEHTTAELDLSLIHI